MYFPRHACEDPRELPELRHALIRLAQEGGPWARSEELRSLQSFQADMHAQHWEKQAMESAMHGLVLQARHSVEWNRITLEKAQLIHVNSEFCDVLFASADSIPADVVLHEDMTPTPHGFCVFEQPFYGIDAGNEGSTVRVDAVSWGPVRFPPRDDRFSHDSALPGFGLQAFRFFDPANHHDQLAEATGDGAPMWLPLGRADWVLGDRLDRTAHDYMDPTSEQHASMEEDRRLHAALWALIQQKRVVEQREVEPSKPARKRLARAGAPSDNSVKVVHLRRPEYRPRHDDGETGRRLGVRFVVRPHWRNQPYGPGRKKRKLILIPPHIKGPEDAPMSHAERVWAVDQ